MHHLILELAEEFKKAQTVAVRSGDTVRISQRIKEASKERLQIFEGLVIRVDRRHSLTYRLTLRKIASGIGLEKSFLMHSPHVVKVEVLRRAKVRRNYLSYMRGRVGKAARLKQVDFNAAEVNKYAQVESPVSAPKAAEEVKLEEPSSPDADLGNSSETAAATETSIQPETLADQAETPTEAA